MYIHKTKDDKSPIEIHSEYRAVTFIGGNKDIMQILTELIKDKCKP